MLTQEETIKALASGKVVYDKFRRFWLENGKLCYQYRKNSRGVVRIVRWTLDSMEGIE